VPCIERVFCPLCLVCLCYHGHCVSYGGAAAPATPVATLGTHALVSLYPLEHATGCVRQGSLRMRAFRWHVCVCDFVCPVDRVIKHKVFCVCVFGPYFLYALVYFVTRATCWSGQTSTTPSLLCHVVGVCMHARAHTGLRSHVIFFHGKRVEECYTSDSARASETNALVDPDTHQCDIAGKPNDNTITPAHDLVYQLVLPCATVVVHARSVRHSLYPAILLPQCCLPLHCRCLPHLPLLLACLNQKLRGARRHPGRQGTEQTLSPLVRVLVSFEHEACLF